MIEIDPNIIKENLPEDIHAVIDQVNANMDAAVKQIVDEFRTKAKETADQFERRQFDKELQEKLDLVKRDLQTDLERMDGAFGEIAKLADEARRLASSQNFTDLKGTTEKLAQETSELQRKLKDFRDKTNTFAEKTGGFIAKAAIKAVTGV